jgi:hypothetical protein
MDGWVAEWMDIRVVRLFACDHIGVREGLQIRVTGVIKVIRVITWTLCDESYWVIKVG